MDSDEDLSECFRDVGERYGYDSIMARYAEFRDLKVRWQRTSSVIEFSVSDYLRDVPDDVTRQLAETLFAKISGERRGYPPGMEEWIGRREFAEAHRPVFLKRASRVIENPAGAHRDLDDVMGRLVDEGLLTGDEGVKTVWTAERMFGKRARVSVVMRVVFVSTDMDSDDVPDYVLDWVVYKEVCHILVGFDPNGTCRCGYEDELTSRFRMKDQAEKWLVDRNESERREAESEMDRRRSSTHRDE